ncbi:MAG: ABC transporter ATP-binding protein/permease [Lachnospiraceae bacterium]|nr:ABC transporter ATP-binding protein/permease [Lachnospiraceae bacterium]
MDKNKQILKNGYPTNVLIRRFLPYFKPYRRTLCADLFCAALTTVCEIVLPLIIRQITNTALEDVALLTTRMVVGLALVYFVLRIIDALANYYMADTGHVMGAKIETDMRRAAYAHLQQLSNTYFNNTKVGQIMGRITNDLFEVTEFAHHCPEEFFIAAIKIVISFIILGRINLTLTLMIFVFVPIMTVVCRIINKKMRKTFSEQRNQIGELNAKIEDSLLGQKVVKAFTNEELESQKFEEGNQDFLKIKTRSYMLMGIFSTSTRVFDGLMYLTIIIGGGFFLMDRRILPGDMVAYVMYVSTLIATIRRIIEFAEQFQRGITGIERFLQIMDADIEIFDDKDAEDIVNPKGEIVFNNVSFEYPDDHNRVFANLNLHIHAGEKLAIVGPSGGGKTTLCNLIPRFYDVSRGEITLDGKNIKKLTLRSLRQSIGVVQQEVYLFSGTVYDNIAYGKPGASYEEVMKAAKRAGADEFIQNLKDKYDTYVGERGVKLSGGQKQRISIARVFLKNPPILILDEATSALDNESEYAVAKSLNELAKGRTTLTIAHRLSSIRNSDRILVLTDEGIVEEGNHEQLMELGGIYHHFYMMANEIK